MALSFIGKPISLISHSDVRYRGILAGIDPQASTIQLSNVYSMGTESRRPPAEFIPPVQEPYQYIIFRASEVKDLAVDEPAQRRSVHDDPAVLGASASGPPLAQPYQQYPAGYPPSQPVPPPQQQPPPHQPQSLPSPTTSPPNAANQNPNHNYNHNRGGRDENQNNSPRPRRNNSVHTAAASLETVERALGDLRLNNNTNANNSRSNGQGRGTPLPVPATDFDFARSNARFDKRRPGGEKDKEQSRDDDEVGTNPSDSESPPQEKAPKSGAYNPSQSFFDQLTPTPVPQRGVRRGGGGGHGPGSRGGGRNRREEERERNVATFGEPGGVGLMGPGAYVGGWGGYGRRGAAGGRGRRATGLGAVTR